MTYTARTPDYYHNRELRNEVSRLNKILSEYQAQRDKAEGEAQAERLHAHEAEQAASQKVVEDQRDLLNRLSIPRPSTASGYRALPYAIKNKLIQAFGPDFPGEVGLFEKSGLASWQEWDKLSGKAQPAPAPVQQPSEQPKIVLDTYDPNVENL